MNLVSFSNGDVLDLDSPEGAYKYVCNSLLNAGCSGAVLSCMEVLKPEKCDAAACGQYPASGSSVFEVVDATDDENYFTLGVFLSLADAMREVESCDEPDDLGGDHGDHGEYCVVKIRERKIGWGGIGREVARYEWKSTYDEAADEYGWIRTQNPTGQPPPRFGGGSVAPGCSTPNG